MHMHPGMSSLVASIECIGPRMDHPQDIARLVGIVLDDTAIVEVAAVDMPRIGIAAAGTPRGGTVDVDLPRLDAAAVDIAAVDRRLADIARDGSSLGDTAHGDIARTDHARVDIELLGAQVAGTEAVDTEPADTAIRTLLAPGKDCSHPCLKGSRRERRRVLIGDGEDEEGVGEARQCCMGVCRQAMVAAQRGRGRRRLLRLL